MSSFFNLLVYGDPGVGKTVLAGSASLVPEMSPVLFVDIEGGTLSIRNRFPDVDRVRINRFEDIATLFNTLKAQFQNGKPVYKTLVLDSLSEIQKFGMYAIMQRGLAKAAEEGRAKDPDQPEIGDWGKNLEQIRKLVRAFRDLPCNTIFTCLAATTQDKRGRSLTHPNLNGKLAAEVAGFLDIVVYMYTKEQDEVMKRALLTLKTDEYVAKDRTDMLPTVVEDPTMSVLYDICFRASAA